MVFYDSNNNGLNPYVPGPVPTGHICMEKELIEVPYEELPKEEKEYGCNMSIEMLKLIMKLGFKICR